MKLSKTNQRKVILQELGSLDTHPTADELYSLVRKKLPNISLGTVYRNLEILSEAGKIQKLHISGKQKRFDGNTNRHFHLRCKICNSVEDIHEGVKKIDNYLKKYLRSLDQEEYNLELRGICASCKTKLFNK